MWLKHASMQSYFIACQLTITHSQILTDKYFIRSRIPAPFLCLQESNNVLELITSTKTMIIQKLSYKLTQSHNWHNHAIDTPELFVNKACLDSITCSHLSRYEMKSQQSHSHGYNPSSCTYPHFQLISSIITYIPLESRHAITQSQAAAYTTHTFLHTVTHSRMF
jgi:hypothetical protein